jgi:arylsulfatase A-like enzyme
MGLRELTQTGDDMRAAHKLVWMLLGILLAFTAGVETAFAQQASKPNILFILNDNTGYGDIGVYGGGERRGAPTPSIDHLASEGLLLTQFFVEPSCTPSRAALMTGRYSIRSGLSLILLEGTSNSLPASEVTMAEMLHDAGYATALFGKWHLGSATSSLPQNKGFDEFYGIPPNASWNSYLRISQVQRTQHVSIPLNEGPQIYEAKRGGPLKVVKPYTEEVRRNIDWELVERGIDFMKRQKAASKPFFLYIPVSRTHFPNLPSKKFEGSSRIGQFGDSLIEGDAAVGALLDALKNLGLEDNTIVAFASDNGPEGPGARDFGGDMPDMGSPGPFRGFLGDVSEGSIRTPAIIRWPGHIKAGQSNAMFSIMDFFPTFAHLADGKVPSDRPIDGVDQTDLLLGKSAMGARDTLLTFVGPKLAAARWNQWRAYFLDIAPGRSGVSGADLSGGLGLSAAPMNGYPKIFNIESDPREEHNVAEQYAWVRAAVMKPVEAYLESVKKHPNPPAANITDFSEK